MSSSILTLSRTPCIKIDPWDSQIPIELYWPRLPTVITRITTDKGIFIKPPDNFQFSCDDKQFENKFKEFIDFLDVALQFVSSQQLQFDTRCIQPDRMRVKFCFDFYITILKILIWFTSEISCDCDVGERNWRFFMNLKKLTRITPLWN